MLDWDIVKTKGATGVPRLDCQVLGARSWVLGINARVVSSTKHPEPSAYPQSLECGYHFVIENKGLGLRLAGYTL